MKKDKKCRYVIFNNKLPHEVAIEDIASESYRNDPDYWPSGISYKNIYKSRYIK